jgi:hypothetical protein
VAVGLARPKKSGSGLPIVPCHVQVITSRLIYPNLENVP